MQRRNPFRSPFWRWTRANELLVAKKYFSSKRDDEAVRIAISYLRDIAACSSELRLARMAIRYEHVDRAKSIWEGQGRPRLEIETRILGRQTDTAIASRMRLPPETIQAYRDLFFQIDDRIDVTHYVQFQVIGIRPGVTPTPVQLMQASVYFKGAWLIEPWLEYFQDGRDPSEDPSRARNNELLEMIVASRSVPIGSESWRSFGKLSSILAQTASSVTLSPSAAQAFRMSTDRIASELLLPSAKLPPCAYAPSKPVSQITALGKQTRKCRKAA